MIISQTPYRVSFAGGGTDLPAFYRNEYGAVLSVAVQKHMSVAYPVSRTCRTPFALRKSRSGAYPSAS